MRQIHFRGRVIADFATLTIRCLIDVNLPKNLSRPSSFRHLSATSIPSDDQTKRQTTK